MRIAGSLFVILLVVAAVLIYQSLFIVNETQRAMVLQFGAPQRVEETPGLKFKTPFIQDVVFFDDRVLELDSPPQELIVLGKKRLVVDAFARYRIS
ncbi:MAG: SPFH domain-containing protein, partial [Pseudomonadota bacterium]